MVVTLGLMGYVGIRLDIATSVIAAMLLGIVVDDSVLLLFQLRHEQRRLQGGHHESARQAMLAAARSTGPCITMTTIVLVIGLLVLTLAQIKSIVWLGVLLPVAMATALVTDLTLLPALSLILMRRYTRSRNRLSDTSPSNEKIAAAMQLEHSHGQ